MLKRFPESVLAGVCLFASVARADFLPPNNLHLEDGLLRDSKITETVFNEIIDQIEAVYAPLVAETHGAELSVNRLWRDSTVNASAIQWGDSWELNMYGGLARRPEITADGFTMVVCHELGHHLAGYPFANSWAANEGASDYFATLSCGRLLWKDDEETNATFRKTVDAYPKAQCDQVYKTIPEQNLCYRLMMAGRSTADLLATLGGTKNNWTTPDNNIVKSTNHAHPAGQCRLDTYMAGALCAAAYDTQLIPGKGFGSSRNSAKAELEALGVSCGKGGQYEFGSRPLCWFKPLL